MSINFRKAKPEDAGQIWTILQQAILRRKADGSNQWQDGYPNPHVVDTDIERQQGYVLLEGDVIAAYAAILINDEPEYARIKGKWLTSGDFVVVHRIAVADTFLGKGFAKQLIHLAGEIACTHNITSVRVDTNFDNSAMLHIFESLGFAYCGQVFFRGSARKAYEKVLNSY
jgi:GNAT superfamily N-acetyltransferase